MRLWDISRYALSSCVALALLAGCGGSQPPIGSFQVQQALTQGHRHASQSAEAYLYVASVAGEIYIFEYPSGKQIGNADLDGPAFGDCRDTIGDVFITAEKEDSGAGLIYEFGPGSTTHSQLLTETEPIANCSYDTSTGDLGVANFASTRYPNGSVAVYSNAQGSPTLYPGPSDFSDLVSAAYDDAGDLFVAGFGPKSAGKMLALAELPSGFGSFNSVLLDRQITTKGSSFNIQWNNGELAVTDYPGKRNGPDIIYHVSISGSTGTVTGTTALKTKGLRSSFNRPWTWIEDDTVLAPVRTGVGIWPFPRGGKSKSFIGGGGAASEVVSSEPPRARLSTPLHK